MPLITAGFWGIGEQLFTKDAYEEMIKNGCSIIETQVLPKSQGINTWKRYYDMTEKQIKLLVYLYDRKINNPQTEIILTKDEIKLIGTDDKVRLKESIDSFMEMNIVLKMD